jgi:DNA-binding response OmpR family regulator
MKLLLFESYGPLARSLRNGLEEEDFAVTLADDLRHATRLLESESFDVILLDLPRQIELALLRNWRGQRICTPVVFLSVPGSRADSFNDLGLGPAALVTKPFRFVDLLSLLRRLCGLRSLNAQDIIDGVLPRGYQGAGRLSRELLSACSQE